MDLISPNLKLPYLAPAQSQKHVTHNEALRQLDAIVQLSVTSVINVPPETPENGQRVIIGPTPEGEFAAHVNAIAAYQDGAGRIMHLQQDGGLISKLCPTSTYLTERHGSRCQGKTSFKR